MFYLLLALSRGVSLTEFLDTTPAWEIPYWRALYKKAPFGPIVEDARTAMTHSLLINPWTDSKKSPETFLLGDRPKCEDDPETMLLKLRSWAGK